MAATQEAETNMHALSTNPYPGRGIIMGCNNSVELIQVYWIMGRSTNSRNRILVRSDDIVKTDPFDPSKVEDPSLIIYNAMRQTYRQHIVSNGNQTDAVESSLHISDNFGWALSEVKHEPDAPNFTSRITGLVIAGYGMDNFTFSKIYPNPADPEDSIRSLYPITSILPGFGFCLHTYLGDGKPLPRFDKDPYLVKLEGSIEDIAKTYWQLLNEENRVALVVKSIKRGSNQTGYQIINKLN